MSTLLIDRLCTIVSAGEMSRAGLARAAGLHPNSLRKLGDADWNPGEDMGQGEEAACEQNDRHDAVERAIESVRLRQQCRGDDFGGNADPKQSPGIHHIHHHVSVRIRPVGSTQLALQRDREMMEQR